MKSFDVEKYLRKNPPPQCRYSGKSSVAVVIPAYNELDTLPDTVNSVITAAKYAKIEPSIIAVVNYPPGADAAESEKLYKKLLSGEFSTAVQTVYLPAAGC